MAIINVDTSVLCLHLSTAQRLTECASRVFPGQSCRTRAPGGEPGPRQARVGLGAEGPARCPSLRPGELRWRGSATSEPRRLGSSLLREEGRAGPALP